MLPDFSIYSHDEYGNVYDEYGVEVDDDIAIEYMDWYVLECEKKWKNIHSWEGVPTEDGYDVFDENGSFVCPAAAEVYPIWEMFNKQLDELYWQKDDCLKENDIPF